MAKAQIEIEQICGNTTDIRKKIKATSLAGVIETQDKINVINKIQAAADV